MKASRSRAAAARLRANARRSWGRSRVDRGHREMIGARRAAVEVRLTAASVPAAPSMFQIFRKRDFSLLWLAQLVLDDRVVADRPRRGDPLSSVITGSALERWASCSW